MAHSRKSEDASRVTLGWSVPIAVEDVAEAGSHFDIAAPDSALPAIAEIAGVRALIFLSANLDVTSRGDGLHVSGTVRARVEQSCVVTLEPLQNEIEEEVDLTFSEKAAADARDVAVAPEDAGDEPPEPMQNGVIDLAAVAVEFLLLGIDPYPRKEDAHFETAVAGNPVVEPPPHPFAALEALKKRDGGQDH